ncbi:DUF721 domain-containing protein, partial [Candidatus Aerophobetes bacterium]|nr:DUF721 domain-containing protein [Candidatus Aerophobetes bacterium]
MTEDNNPPSRVGEILNNLLSQLGFESKIREMKVLKSWQEVVGKGISKHSQPVKISKGNLLVKVDSSAWINELCHLKDKIIEKFNKLHKNEVIKDIHFRLGKIAPSFSRVRRGRRRARNINLNEEELDWVEKTVGKLKDENLKEAV